MKHLTAIFCLVFSGLLFAADFPNIQVTGKGHIEVMPDYLNLHISIEKTRESKATAKKQVDTITQQVIEAALSLGIKKEHIDSSKLFIQPEYRWQNQTQTLVGERVNREITIKLYKLQNYTILAEKLSLLGITRMYQTGYGFDNIAELENIAMIKALSNAKTKAENIAKHTDRSLGQVFQVTEGHTSSMPRVQMMGAMEKGRSAESNGAPLEISPQKIETSVNVIYLVH